MSFLKSKMFVSFFPKFLDLFCLYFDFKIQFENIWTIIQNCPEIVINPFLISVVTGGTDGIGKAYTCELAKRGLKKFVLIGRNEQKLNDVKNFLGEFFFSISRGFIFFPCLL